MQGTPALPPARRRGILFFAQTGGAPFVTVFGARKKFSHFAKKLLDIVPTAWYYNKRSKRAAVCAGQKIEYALLAQLDRVFGYEPKGQGFESLAAHQKHRILSCAFLLCRGESTGGFPKGSLCGKLPPQAADEGRSSGTHKPPQKHGFRKAGPVQAGRPWPHPALLKQPYQKTRCVR